MRQQFIAESKNVALAEENAKLRSTLNKAHRYVQPLITAAFVGQVMDRRIDADEMLDGLIEISEVLCSDSEVATKARD